MSQDELYERVGKSVISSFSKAQNESQMHFMALKSRENVLVLRSLHIVKTVSLQPLKSMQSS